MSQEFGKITSASGASIEARIVHLEQLVQRLVSAVVGAESGNAGGGNKAHFSGSDKQKQIFAQLASIAPEVMSASRSTGMGKRSMSGGVDGNISGGKTQKVNLSLSVNQVMAELAGVIAKAKTRS